MANPQKQSTLAKNTYDPYMKTDYSIGRRQKPGKRPVKELVDIVPAKAWIKYLLISLIPIVNLIALFAWHLKNNAKVNPSVKTFAIVAFWIYLSLYIIASVIVLVLKFALNLF